MTKTMPRFFAAVVTSALLAACGDSGGRDTDDTTTTMTTPSTATETGTPTTGTEIPTTSNGPTDPSTTNGPTDPSTTDPDPSETDATTDDPPDDPPDPFVFDETPPGDLVQLDRMGMPAIATAVISSNLKDAYNEATPADDAMGTFVDDIVANVTGLHAALDDDLIGLGLTPCAPDKCVAQAAPLVVPDALTINIQQAAGFPNGRMLADPVIDVTLAVVLLDLDVHGAGTLAGVPVNPPENDVPFLDDFPYLGLPH